MKIFQQADIVPDDLSPSTWNSDPLSPVSNVSTSTSPTSVSTDDGVSTSDPTYKPNRESSTVPTPMFQREHLMIFHWKLITLPTTQMLLILDMVD